MLTELLRLENIFICLQNYRPSFFFSGAVFALLLVFLLLKAAVVLFEYYTEINDF